MTPYSAQDDKRMFSTPITFSQYHTTEDLIAVDWSCCYLLRFKCIAQEQVAPAALDAHEGSPAGILRGKPLAHDETGPLNFPVATSNLWGERQKQFVQSLPGKEIPHQLWSALDQDHLTLPDTVHLMQDSLGTQGTGTLDCRELHGRWKMLCVRAPHPTETPEDRGQLHRE